MVGTLDRFAPLVLAEPPTVVQLLAHQHSRYPAGWSCDWQLPPRRESVGRVRDLVEEWIQALFPEETVADLALLASEASTNSIKHGPEHKNVLMSFSFHGRRRRLTMEFGDTNGQDGFWIPWRPTRQRSGLSQMEAICEASGGIGQGLFIIRKLVKELRGRLRIMRRNIWNLLRVSVPVPDRAHPHCPDCVYGLSYLSEHQRCA